MAQMEAREAVKAVSKAKVKGQVVEVNGEPVRESLVHYGGVDLFFADGSQTRLAADDKVSVTVKDSDVSAHDAVIVGSPWGARAVDERVAADNEESAKEAKKATNSAKKASKKSDA